MPTPYHNADLAPQALARARVYERNQTAYARLRARATGGRVLKENGVEVMAAPWVSVFNGLFPPRWPAAACAARLKEALRLYKGLDQGMFCVTGPSSNDGALRPLLLEKGFQCTYWAPFMHLDPKACPTVKAPAGISVEAIADFDFFDATPHPWIGPPTTAKRRAELAFTAGLCAGKKPRAWQFVALEGGRAVGAALLFAYRGEGGIYDVVVDKAYRRRGIGTAMLARAGGQARALGLKAVGLAATGMGVGLYQKVGFEVAGRFGSYFLSAAKVRGLAL